MCVAALGAVCFKAWNPPSALHPGIAIHSPLIFDLVDTWFGGPGEARSLGGCTYHVVHAGGRNYEGSPVNASESRHDASRASGATDTRQAA